MRPSRATGILAIVFSLLALSCEEEPEYGGFVENNARTSEGGGSQSMLIDLGATTTTSTVITFQVGGNAALDGDYYITSITNYYSNALTVTVPAGESTAEITFDVIDDEQVEPANELIYFEITSISDAAIAENFKRTSFVYEIEDNDEAPVSGLQIDLAWDLGDGVRVNNSNFDLYLANNITTDTDGVVKDFQPVTGEESVNESGFETIMIDNALPDQQYYVVIKYSSGENPATLTLQLSSGQIHRGATGRVTAAAIGTYLYYGPITKTGTAFTFR